MSGVWILYRWLCFCVLPQRKDEERQKEEEVTEELKRLMMQEMARVFYLFEETPECERHRTQT